MGHENARNGIGKVFTAEVLQIVAAACTLIMGILTAVTIGAAANGSVGGTVGAGVGAGVFAFAASIMAVIAYILMLVGLNKAGQDNDQIKAAFTLSIITLIVSIVVGLISSFVGAGYSWISDLGQLVALILSLVITYKILMGCAELNSALADKANSTWKMYMIVIILDIVVTIVTVILGVMGITAVSAVAYLILVILDVVFDVISYIMFLMFLARARKEV
ncbi:MAG: hypothetical protein K5644_01975 [Lachnospiraceae bacterium]|nr:hypothetical protein [Lachnospiraceae bacterium]